MKTEVETKHVEFYPNSVWFAIGVQQEKWPNENARYIFWSGALAFLGPKIIFLHDKHEELLVSRAGLFYFMYIRIPPM